MKPKPRLPAPAPVAVRTVSETDDVRLLEGLAFPFRGRDTYGTFFSARTDYAWDLFPDVEPSTASRAAAEAPRFIRPVTFHHGFDSEIGLRRHGGWSPVRMDADGVWVQAQLAKRAAYYDRLAPLLDANALGLSGGSAEHSVRIDDRSGEVLAWPAYELALTPTESNPLAQLAARSGEGVAALRLVASLAGQGLEARLDPPAAARAIQTFNDIVAGAELSEELPEAFDTLTSAIYSAIYATDAAWNALPLEDKTAAIQTSLDQFRDYVLGLIDSTSGDTSARAFLSAIRAGRRHSASDQEHIDAIHKHAAALGPSAADDSSSSSTSTDGSADAEPAASRSGDVPPAGLRLVERIDPEQQRAELLANAEAIGRATATRLLGR